tara:strand:- start:175 stop:1239 length:1065 start_codon:yes stop_codon:yes gene_type:complete
MLSSYKLAPIKNIIITSEYSPTNKRIDINISESGNDISIENLSAIRQLSNLEKIESVKEYFSSFFSVLNINQNFNYKLMLGRPKSKEYLAYLKDIINKSIPLITSYHFDIYPKRYKCYKNLNPVFLNNEKLELPVYSHSGVTGRTTIKKGFNFLTLKKDKRKLLKTQNNMKLIEVDFKSCEPFFYLKSQHISVDNNDVYHWISEKYNIDIKNRDYTKRGFLSMIYGANENTVSRVMNISTSKVSLIKRELGLVDLKKELQDQFNSQGHVCNYYGRPITSDSNLVNYWIQSSAVDFCSLAFKSFIDNNDIFPNFFIHDSMTFSVSEQHLDKILNTTSVSCPHSNIEIPVEFNIIS